MTSFFDSVPTEYVTNGLMSVLQSRLFPPAVEIDDGDDDDDGAEEAAAAAGPCGGGTGKPPPPPPELAAILLPSYSTE
jgi:hypothetical protein